MSATHRPLVSVVTNSYNAERFLRDNVASVLAQRYERWEHVVVDCGSTDGSLELLESLEHGRLRVLRVPFCGVARGRMHGIEAAKGDLVAVLDADDAALPHRLGSQVEVLAAQPDVVGCGGGIVQVTEKSGRERRYTYPARHEALVRLLMAAINPLPHSTLTFRRGAYDRVGGYSDVFEKCEDFDFLLRLARVGRLASIGRPVVRYTIHDDSHTFLHRPKGRDAKYYAMLAVLLHALDDRPGAAPPSVDAATAWLDRIGPDGMRALSARWAMRGVGRATRELDLASLRYLASAQLRWAAALVRHRREDWWRYSSTPARVAETLGR
jgi:glycosyltransferase involved in cell wall biosynthesis